MSINASFVLMPKTSSYLDNLSGTRKHKIRLSWKCRGMKTKPVVHCTDETADFLFWFCASASDTTHVFTAPFGGEGVGH